MREATSSWHAHSWLSGVCLSRPYIARTASRRSGADAIPPRIRRRIRRTDRTRDVVRLTARGEARDGSDYDIAVFLREFKERWPEMDRLVEIDLLYETGVFVHALPFRTGARQERSPLMSAVRREGVDL